LAIRTRRSILHFACPFPLPGFEKAQPAGDYMVDHDEESIEGSSWTAWHHIGAFIHLPAIGVKSTGHQMVPINSADLKSALNKELE
jgi:hypothetical protein